MDGNNTEDEREYWFNKLESNDDDLQFIISRDILNEGVDLPSVNMIVMLRPTKSSIIFIQQLGRGLRKRDDKEFVTVLDFIGNYDNNYNIPIALFGDNTRNKENLRRKMILGNNIIPGASSISFDRVSKERIFRAINSGRMSSKIELKNAYIVASKKFGHEPNLCELYEEKSIDPRTIIEKYKSLNSFRIEIKSSSFEKLNEDETRILNEVSNLAVNCIRPFEGIILKSLIKNGKISVDQLVEESSKTFRSSADLDLIRDSYLVLTKEYGYVKESLCRKESETIYPTDLLNVVLKNDKLVGLLLDCIDCGLMIFENEYMNYTDKFGLTLYKIYSRTDFCRSINIKKSNDSTLYGYGIRGDYCPLFVIYKKDAGETPLYNDHFIDRNTFYWESRPTTIDSAEIQRMIMSNSKTLNLLLFITKDESEDDKFYYCGSVKYVEGTAKEAKSYDKRGILKDVVSIILKLESTVPEKIYDYLTHSMTEKEITIDSITDGM